MNDIEKKALALLNEVSGGSPVNYYALRDDVVVKALCRAIEQHEAFRQEVSDAVEAYLSHTRPWPDNSLRRFIITKPDPLVEAVKDCQFASLDAIEDYVAKKLREAIAKRGGKIVWEDE